MHTAKPNDAGIISFPGRFHSLLCATTNTV